MAGALGVGSELEDSPKQLLDLRRSRMSSRIGQTEAAETSIQELLRNLQHALGRHLTFKAAAEGGLDRQLYTFPRAGRLMCHRENARSGVGDRHAGVLLAVGFARGNTHAEHLNPARHAALQALR